MATNVSDSTEEEAEVPYVPLLCSLCSMSYRDPKILPCLHSFCEPCLEEHQRDVCGEEEPLTCPVTFCQNPTDEQDPQSLADNLWLKNKMNTDARVQEVVEGGCYICNKKSKKSNATYMYTFCTNCMTAMCSGCLDNWHNENKAFKTHSLISLSKDSFDELKASLTTIQHHYCNCDGWEKREVEFYCRECQKPSCSYCLLAGPCKGHQCESLPDVVQGIKESLTTSAQSLHDPVEKLDDTLAECENTKEQLSAREKAVEEEINAAADEIIASVMRQKKALLDLCHEIAQSKRTRLNLQTEQLLRTKQQLEHCSQVISAACESHSSTELLAVSDMMTSRVEHLKTTFNETELSPCTSELIVANINAQVNLGYVTEGCYPQLSVLEVPVGKPLVYELDQEYELRLVTRDEDEELHSYGGATVEASLSGSGGSVTHIDVTDNDDGTYHLSFTLASVGSYQLNVRVNGCEIMGSPFKVKVQCSEISEIQALLSKRVSYSAREQDRYLVSYDWLTKWKEYAQYILHPQRATHKEVCCPGPVDNANLYTWSNMLKKDLKNGKDYDHVSKPAWDLLVAKHGLSSNSKPIVRPMDYVDRFSIHPVELYPLNLVVSLSGYSMTLQCCFSKFKTIRDVKLKACEMLLLPNCQLQPYSYHRDDTKLASAGIRDGEVGHWCSNADHVIFEGLDIDSASLCKWNVELTN